MFLWSWDNMTGPVKAYVQHSSILDLIYNKNGILASGCEHGSFGLLYSIDDKNFDDIFIKEEINSLDWSPDGKLLAIGVVNNKVYVRDEKGDPFVSFYNDTCVWRVKFHPIPTKDNTYYLYTLDLNKKIQFFLISKNKEINIIKKVDLSEIPTSIYFLPSAFAFVITDSGGSVQVWYPELIYVQEIMKARPREAALVATVYPNKLAVLIGTDEGRIIEIIFKFPFFSSISGNRCAYSDGNSYIIIQHIKTKEKAYIETKKIALKISLNKKNLGLLFPNKIKIYGVKKEVKKNMNYILFYKVRHSSEINLFQIYSLNFITSYKRSIKVTNCSNEVKLCMNFDFQITCCSVVSSTKGMEQLLVGFNNGDVQKIFVNKSCSQLILRGNGNSITFLSLSMQKKKLMTIDENHTLEIFNIESSYGTKIDSISDVSSASWNSEIDEMFCFTKIENLKLIVKLAGIHNKEEETIKNKRISNEFGPIEIEYTGSIIKFEKADIYCLNNYQTNIQSLPVHKLVEQLIMIKNFPKALKIAYLGIPEQLWNKLAEEALKDNQYHIAEKAYQKLKSLPNILFTRNLIVEGSKEVIPSHEIDAELKARDGKIKQAINIYNDKNQCNIAYKLADTMKNSDKVIPLIIREKNLKKKNPNLHKRIYCRKCPYRRSISVAKDDLKNGKNENAQKIFNLLGETEKGIDVIIKSGKIDECFEICKKLDVNIIEQRKTIEKCLNLFVTKGHFYYIKETLTKLGRNKEILNILIQFKKWKEAIEFSKQNNLSLIEYAELYLSDMKKAGKNEEILDFYLSNFQIIENTSFLNEVLEFLLNKNSKDEIFKCYWALSRILIKTYKNTKEFDQFKKYTSLSNLYFAYGFILNYHNSYEMNPNKSRKYDIKILNASSFVLNLIQEYTPQNIEKVVVLNILGITCEKLGLYQTAKRIFQYLLTHKLSDCMQREAELHFLKLKANSTQDTKGLAPKCYNCNKTNSIFPSLKNDKCKFCQNDFIRCTKSFQVLPLIEFKGISNKINSRVKFPGSPHSSINETESNDLPNNRMLSSRSSSKNLVSPAANLEIRTLDQSPYLKKRASLITQGSESSIPEFRFSDEMKYLDQPIEHEKECSNEFCEDFSLISKNFPIKYYKQKSTSKNIVQCIECRNFFSKNTKGNEIISYSNCYFCSFLLRSNKNKCVQLKFNTRNKI